MRLFDPYLLILITLLTLPLTAGCSRGRKQAGPADPHSYARPSEVAVKHLDLDVAVDFDARSLSGRASLTLDNKTRAERLHLDARGLTIKAVFLDDDETAGVFALGEDDPIRGRELAIEIRPETETVHVDYSSSPDAAALLWLEPEQTASAKPFLFSQSQAILARTWIPIQDSPGVRITYDATVRVPSDLMAVMSASNPTERNPEGVYRFSMPQPVPAYLLALAVGDLEFRAMGERTGVYAEPTVVEKAAWEFADTEKMIAAAEELYGPYRWGRYDILVLPPSFPFGGMENPRLTFATPTILAGDRSLTSLVAHELAHSWSGNLVTNATWNDFWLNEGFTTYFERRIMEAVYGRDYAEMLASLGLQDLRGTLDELGAGGGDTHLYLSLAGRDPDDGMTDVAYDKGAFFLRRIEETVGRERFDAFLRAYFDRFAFETMDTPSFLDHLKGELLTPEEATTVDVAAWVYGPGLPPGAPEIQSGAFGQVEAQIAAWTQDGAAAELDTQGWTTHHWLHFIRNLPESLDAEGMAGLDAAFELSATGNSEILHAWLLRAIESGYEPAYPALESFLTRMGRRKFLKPLYAALAATPEGLERAKGIYARARPSYHTVSTATLDEILGWGDGAPEG